jgi:hypothetical protein
MVGGDGSGIRRPYRTVCRLCGATRCDEDGRPVGDAFMLRTAEAYLSTNWLEGTGAPTRADQLATVRRHLADKGMNLSANTRLAVLHLHTVIEHVMAFAALTIPLARSTRSGWPGSGAKTTNRTWPSGTKSTAKCPGRISLPLRSEGCEGHNRNSGASEIRQGLQEQQHLAQRFGRIVRQRLLFLLERAQQEIQAARQALAIGQARASTQRSDLLTNSLLWRPQDFQHHWIQTRPAISDRPRAGKE